MANKLKKFPENVKGAYYVDDQCIACDVCVIEAPKFFAMNDQEGHAYVMAWPKSKSDLEDCENAKNACPVDAIGSDGLE